MPGVAVAAVAEVACLGCSWVVQKTRGRANRARPGSVGRPPSHHPAELLFELLVRNLDHGRPAVRAGVRQLAVMKLLEQRAQLDEELAKQEG